MKSLQEIINRNDYKNMNAALIKRAIEVAEIIRKQMQYLDFKEDCTYRFGGKNNEIKLSLTTFRERSLNYSETHLCVVESEDYFNQFALDEPRTYRLNCGMGTLIEVASYKQFCKFLNMANTILQELDETETQLVERGKQALENSANVVE